MIGEDAIGEFFTTARERYQIFLRRRRGEPPPWTDSQTFQRWRFCNVFREHDRTTEWVRENIRDPLWDQQRVVTAMALARLTNRISTMEKLHEAGLFHNWDARRAIEVMDSCHSVVTGAYRINTPASRSKVHGVAWIVDGVHEIEAVVWENAKNLQSTWQMLQSVPYVGGFIAYEITSDLRWTSMLKDAPDVLTWANPGPGAIQGLSILDHDLRFSNKATSRITMMQHLLSLSQHHTYWPSEWPSWEMREVEHWLCEFAKWCRAEHYGQRLKRRFQA